MASSDMESITISDVTSEVTKIFKRQLESEWTHEKAPYGLRMAWERPPPLTSPGDHTEQIFRRSGFQAWLAFYTANHHLRRQHQRLQAEHRAMSAFFLLPEAQRVEVAVEIASIDAHRSVMTAMQDLQSTRSEKRRRLTADDGTEALFSPSRDALTTSPPEERSDIFLNNTTASGSTTATTGNPLEQKRAVSKTPILDSQLEGQHEAVSATSSATNSDHIGDTIKGLPRRHRIVSKPVTGRITAVFPQYMCGAIQKVGGAAAITMVYSPSFATSQAPCHLSLEIHANKIEFIAMELFGVHVETEEGVRYIVLENGVRLIPREMVILQGARIEAASALFGSDISCAVAESPGRIEEVKQALLATRCVSMQITRVGNGAALNLHLGLEAAMRLEKKLF